MNEQWIKGRLKAAWLCATVALCIAVAGCVAPAVDTTPRVAPSFDYTPTQHAEPMSANITFAVVGTEFETPLPLFERFSSSMAGDFAEILTARGYSIRGPFRTYDEMTFPDKQGSNLVLSATVDFSSDTSQLKRVALGSVLGVVDAVLGTGTSSDTQYRVEGTVRVEGRVTLIVSESLTAEKMWTKSVAIEPINVSVEGTQTYSRVELEFSTLTEILERENQFYTDLGRALEGLYVEVMKRTYAHLDPEEMVMIDRQADSLRERKRY